MTTITGYWWNREANFGDLLTPLILAYYGINVIHRELWRRPRIIGVGSLLHLIPNGYRGRIVGSGLIEDQSHPLPHAKIAAVRGELTRHRIGAPVATALGDPGLLVSALATRRPRPTCRLGIVPHFADADDARVAIWARAHAGEVVIIDVTRDPIDVLEAIAGCEYVLSSSLHGLIAADSLGIPNGWVALSRRVRGGDFKFCDYYSALGTEAEPLQVSGDESVANLISLTRCPPSTVESAKLRLDAVLQELSEDLLAESSRCWTRRFGRG